MTLSDCLDATKKFVAVIGDAVDNREFARSDKNLAAAGCLHISFEHHASIPLLVEKLHRGSAVALVRPQLETFVRGAWIFRCATDVAAVGFLAGKEPPHFGDLILALEKHSFFKGGALSHVKAKAWTVLCDYTHGGGRHVTRRITADEVIQSYADEELIEMLAFCNLIALMAAAEISELTQSVDISEAVYAAYSDIPKHI